MRYRISVRDRTSLVKPLTGVVNGKPVRAPFLVLVLVVVLILEFGR